MESASVHIGRSSSSSSSEDRRRNSELERVLAFWMEIVLMNPKRAKWVVEQVDVHNGRRVFHVIIWGWLESQRVWQTWNKSLRKSIKSQPSVCRLIGRCNVFLYITLPSVIMNQLAGFSDTNRYKRCSPLPHSTHHLFGFTSSIQLTPSSPSQWHPSSAPAMAGRSQLRSLQYCL